MSTQGEIRYKMMIEGTDKALSGVGNKMIG